ncbi:MAG: hypothetical protein HUJ68_14095 [Clostridia bacterium]|nr:hypothetical protein [Clostridia bacterium]
MSEITINQYELEKSLAPTLPELTEDEWKDLKNLLKEYGEENKDSNYFMLLAYEKRDYTLFAFKQNKNYEKFAIEVIELINSRGTLRNYEKFENRVEFWIEDVFYMLFPYDLGVIEI